jgi:hypothetical protein
MTQISPDRLLSVVRDRASQRSAILIVFWARINGDRTQYQNALKGARGSQSVVPLVVRDGFANANAIHGDLADLIDENHGEFDWLVTPFTVSNPLVIVILARTDLGVAQVCSPVVLPEWLPGLGGKATEVTIESLSIAATAPLNASESRIDEIATVLFALEGALLERLKAVLASDHRRANPFFQSIKERDSPETFGDFLSAADVYRRSVKHPLAFRPSAGEGSSLVGRVMRLVSATSPDKLPGVSKRMADALWLDASKATNIKESLPAVLLRPTLRDPDSETRVARNLLVSLFATSQFVTAAAHADDYPGFLVVLLQAMSYNLRETLRDLSEHIQSLDSPPLRVIPPEHRSRSP